MRPPALVERLRAVAARDPQLTLTDNHEASFWLRGRLADLRARWSSGEISWCTHLPPTDGMAVMALWEPRNAVCVRCASALIVTGPADRTCDRCATVVSLIHPHVVLAGTVCVAFGLCPSCHVREVGA